MHTDVFFVIAVTWNKKKEKLKNFKLLKLLVLYLKTLSRAPVKN